MPTWITRLLEPLSSGGCSMGCGFFTVGIIAQPDWKKLRAISPLLAPPVSSLAYPAGNVDSMVNNYTPNLKRRSEDVYSPGGVLKRPDRATIVYTNKVHELFP